MPNWTSNRIRVSGDPHRIRSFLDAVSTDETRFDFNVLIPMPELLKSTGCGRSVIDGEEVSSWYIVSRGDDLNTPGEVRAFTAEERELLRDLGYSNWYDWAVANWGTKWNAASVSITAATFLEPGEIEISFDTAWNAPLPVFRKMIGLFPNLRFVCRWIDEEEPDIEHTIDSEALEDGDEE